MTRPVDVNGLGLGASSALANVAAFRLRMTFLDENEKVAARLGGLIAKRSGLGGLAQYSGWVGMEARTEGTIMADGNPVELHYEIPEGTKKAELVVRTGSGLELHRIDITGATQPYPWAGTSPGGEPLLKGEYALEIEASDASGDVETVKVSAYAEVAEVRAGSGGTEIVLKTGQTVAPEEITALRGK